MNTIINSHKSNRVAYGLNVKTIPPSGDIGLFHGSDANYYQLRLGPSESNMVIQIIFGSKNKGLFNAMVNH